MVWVLIFKMLMSQRCPVRRPVNPLRDGLGRSLLVVSDRKPTQTSLSQKGKWTDLCKQTKKGRSGFRGD